jgi:hypothetical protein
MSTPRGNSHARKALRQFALRRSTRRAHAAHTLGKVLRLLALTSRRVARLTWNCTSLVGMEASSSRTLPKKATGSSNWQATIHWQ